MIIIVVIIIKQPLRVGSFTSADGDWGTATQWSNNTLPGSTDNIVINHDMTISSDIQAGRVEISSSKSITINAGSSLKITGELKQLWNSYIKFKFGRFFIFNCRQQSR